MLKGTTDPEKVNRALKAFNEAMEAAINRCKRLDSLRTRLEFHSMNSEAGIFLEGRQTKEKEVGATQPEEQERDGASGPSLSLRPGGCRPETRQVEDVWAQVDVILFSGQDRRDGTRANSSGQDGLGAGATRAYLASSEAGGR
jgi:hypothetical protein